MSLIAITEIQHGNDDGSVTKFGIGDTVTGLTEEQEASLVAAGSVLETGKDRKYTEAPQPGNVDEDTRKRDELIARAAAGQDLSPAVVAAIASNSSNAAAEKPEEVEPVAQDTMGAAASTGSTTAGDKSDKKS